MKKKVIIMGAAGRDFHNFNMVFRNNEDYEVVAFTATQIPYIDERKYPAELSGELYPEGVPIFPEEKLQELIKEKEIDEVVFSYSDVSYSYLMSRGALVNAAGADFKLLGAEETMLESSKKVVAICASRTGCGKSQTTRRVCDVLKEKGRTVAVVRHPMPYGDLRKQEVQRFASYEDLDKHKCTIEEREEYEPHIDRGIVVYAGVDYEKILRQAEQEADVVVWDGGNNDTSFYKADLYVTVVDPLRAGDELKYYPGETNVRLADVIIVNKEDSATPEEIELVKKNVLSVNPEVKVIDADSPVTVEDPSVIAGKRVLVVEDGPTLTHGGMKFGAGTVAANKVGVSEIVDPRPFLVGTLKDTFEKYPSVGKILPAMGYSGQQVEDLQETINSSDVDAVVIGTPIDLRRILEIKKPNTRVRYELEEKSSPGLKEFLEEF